VGNEGDNNRGGGGVLTDNGVVLTMLRCLVRNCIVTENRLGGGVQVVNGMGSFIDCEFQNNGKIGISGTQGGGVRIGPYASENPENVTFSRCTFTGNSAGRGGGVYNRGPVVFTNCTFDANNGYGSQIYGYNGNVDIIGCTFQNGDFFSFFSQFQIINSLFVNPVFNGGNTSSLGGNVTSSISGNNGNVFNQSSDKNNQTIVLSTLQQNPGGLIRTFAIDASSPAVNAGLGSTTQPGITLPTRDANNQPRQCNPDAGAFEVQTGSIAFTQQPASGSSVNVGASVSVPVSVSGIVDTYQWYRNGTPIEGQTSATLTLNSVQLSQAGSYSLVATSSCNSVTSNAFNLTVLSPASLSGTKTVSGNTTPGSIVTYIVSLTNSSQYAQLDNPGNEFTDGLTSSLSLISAEANNNNGTAVPHYDNNSVTWNGTIPGNSSITITIKATIKNGTSGQTISNQGSISYDADGNGTNEFTALTDDPSVSGATNPTTFVVTCAPLSASLTNSGPVSDTNPTVTLTATGGTTYAFSSGATPSGNGRATVTTPGVYSVTATGSNGCTGVASTTVAGAQNPATVCRGGTVVIKVVASGNPVKYEWYKNTLSSVRLTEIPNQQRGTATSSLTLTNQQANANFYVRVTDVNGSAIVYGPFKVTVNMGCITPLGRLAAEETELKITVLGNPIIGEQLRATVSGAAGKALNLQLLDLSGKPVKTQNWQQADANQPVEWNLSAQASGVYLLQAVMDADGSTPAQRHSVKVIKP